MKKLLLGLGSISAIALPVVAAVSCSAGSFLKSKINSVGEAQKDVKKILGELSEDGKLSKDTDKYTSGLSADNVIQLRNGLTREDLKNLDPGESVKNMKMETGKRNFGFNDWTGMHNDFYSEFQVTLADETKAFVYIYFKYDKTNGVFATGKKSWLVNGVIAAGNAIQKLKHVISHIVISTKEI